MTLISSEPFAKYAKMPTESSFLMSIASLKEGKVYAENIEAISCKCREKICEIKYLVPNIEDSGMPVRNKIYFKYNNSTGDFYKNENETDENKIISDTLLIDTDGDRKYIEHEKNQEEIQLAYAVNKSTNENHEVEGKRLRNNVEEQIGWKYTTLNNKNRAIAPSKNRYEITSDGDITKINTYKVTLNLLEPETSMTIVECAYSAKHEIKTGEEGSASYTIVGEIGEQIEYSFNKPLYRYDDGTENGTNGPIYETIENKDIVRNITLKPNNEFEGLITRETINDKYVGRALSAANSWENVSSIALATSTSLHKVLYRVSNVRISNLKQNKTATTNYTVTACGQTLGEGTLTNTSEKYNFSLEGPITYDIIKLQSTGIYIKAKSTYKPASILKRNTVSANVSYTVEYVTYP